MNENNENQPVKESDPHGRRDAETQMVLGIFVSVMSIPVIIGTVWAEKSHAMIVNLVAGLTLLGVGISMIFWSRRSSKNLSD